MVTVRKPVVAGQFYPGSRLQLEKTIEGLFRDSPTKIAKIPAKAVILPHAGYMYSGAVAASTIASVELKDILVILGPNHTGLGARFSVMTKGIWQTPLGDVKVEETLAQALVDGTSPLEDDILAHAQEHSIEVLLPLWQAVKKAFTIVPIVIGHATSAIYQNIADHIADTLLQRHLADKISFVASSDMTHYETQTSANAKDRYAIEAILNLDAREMLRRIETKDISMCGAAPVAVMLYVLQKLGAKEAQLIQYRTSGDVTGDHRSVVGYAGIRIR